MSSNHKPVKQLGGFDYKQLKELEETRVQYEGTTGMKTNQSVVTSTAQRSTIDTQLWSHTTHGTALGQYPKGRYNNTCSTNVQPNTPPFTNIHACPTCTTIERIATLHPNDPAPSYTISVNIQAEVEGEGAAWEDEANVNIRDGTINPKRDIINESKSHKKVVIKAHMFLDSGATESNYVSQDVISAILRKHANKKTS